MPVADSTSHFNRVKINEMFEYSHTVIMPRHIYHDIPASIRPLNPSVAHTTRVAGMIAHVGVLLWVLLAASCVVPEAIVIGSHAIVPRSADWQIFANAWGVLQTK